MKKITVMLQNTATVMDPRPWRWCHSSHRTLGTDRPPTLLQVLPLPCPKWTLQPYKEGKEREGHRLQPLEKKNILFELITVLREHWKSVLPLDGCGLKPQPFLSTQGRDTSNYEYSQQEGNPCLEMCETTNPREQCS